MTTSRLRIIAAIVLFIIVGNLLYNPAPAGPGDPEPACGERVYVSAWWPDAWYVVECE